MFQTSRSNTAQDLINEAAERGEAALQAGVDTAQLAVNGLSESAHRLQADAAALRERSIDALRDGTRLVRDRAQWAGDRSVSYIRHEPVKSVLVAAAAGAALMALFSLIGSRSGR
jgi:ElaB/YqjD/DUF883 family membrane-anchored ribosome-binding protein